MAKRRKKAMQEKSVLLSEGYTECVDCGKMLKPGSRRCPECGSLTRSTKRLMVTAAITVIVLVAAVAAYAFYPREDGYRPPPTVVTANPTGYSAPISAEIAVSFNMAMDVASVEAAFDISPDIQGTFTWSRTTMTYTPAQPLPDDTYFTVTIGSDARDVDGSPLDCGSFTWSFSTADIPVVRREIGMGAGDFWTVYPDSHPSAGSPVTHPDWAVTALGQGAVLIFGHSEGCYPCTQQNEICESVYASHPSLQYLDLLSGTDEPQSSQAFAAYDPNGGVNYVPLTVIVTRALDDYGEEVIAWHSWEGVVDLVTLTSWIEDAESFYDECT